MPTLNKTEIWRNDNYIFRGDNYSSPILERGFMGHYFNIGIFEENKELSRISIPYYPEGLGRGLGSVVWQEDGSNCSFFKHSNGIVRADARLTLMLAPDADIPIDLMDVFFKQGNAVLVRGAYGFPNSVDLCQFTTKEVSGYRPENRQIEVLTKNVLDRYFSEDEGYSLQKLQDWIADSRHGLPDIHRNAVRGLLEV